MTRRQHLATAGDTDRPVREPPGRIVRPDDQPGAHVGERAGEDATDDVLAPDLEPAVQLADLVGLLRKRIPRRRLVDPGGSGKS